MGFWRVAKAILTGGGSEVVKPKKVAQAVVDFHEDITRGVIQLTLTPAGLFGDGYQPEYETGAGKIQEQLLGINDDVWKTSAYQLAQIPNSITGHTWTPEYETNVGQFLGAVGEAGNDSSLIAAKEFGAAFGADELHEDLIKGYDADEYMAHLYRDVDSGVDWVDDALDATKKVYGVVGGVVGAFYSSQSGIRYPSDEDQNSTTTPEQPPLLIDESTEFNVMPIIIGAVAILLIIIIARS